MYAVACFEVMYQRNCLAKEALIKFTFVFQQDMGPQYLGADFTKFPYMKEQSVQQDACTQCILITIVLIVTGGHYQLLAQCILPVQIFLGKSA